MVKNLPANAGDLDLSLGSGRSPGEGNGNPLQYSCLESSTDRGAWWATVHGVAKSWTRLSDFHVTSLYTVYECMYFKTAMKANFSVLTLTAKKNI